MPTFMMAVLWGLISGSGLLVGALAAELFSNKLSHRSIAAVMGFGGGVLIALVSLDLIDEAYRSGDPIAAVLGLLAGAITFSFINWRLASHGAKNRKRCGDCVQQATEQDQQGSGLAIAVGTILDGIPEALVIGLSLVGGGKLGLGLVAGFFLANVPQGLSSAAGMKRAGRSRKYILTVWIGIPLLIGISAGVGYLILGYASPQVPPAILAFAAGAVLAMLAEAMIPEAFENAQSFIGVITVVGFLAALMMIEH